MKIVEFDGYNPEIHVMNNLPQIYFSEINSYKSTNIKSHLYFKLLIHDSLLIPVLFRNIFLWKYKSDLISIFLFFIFLFGNCFPLALYSAELPLSVSPSLSEPGDLITITGDGFQEGAKTWFWGGGPFNLATVNIPGLSSNLIVVNEYAYMASGNTGLHIIDISDPKSPVIIVNIDTPGTALDITIQGDYAYLADGDSGLQVIDISDPKTPVIIGNLNTSGIAFDISIKGNYAYLIDRDTGLHVIDISNPKLPIFIGNVDTPGRASDIYINGNYAYLADGASGLQVIDISNPKSPIFIGNVDTPGRASDIYINDNYAYLADGDSGLQVIDISNPKSPLIIGNVDIPPITSDIKVDGNHAYLASDGLLVIDISNPQKPLVVADFGAPAQCVSIIDNYAYLGGGNPNSLKVIEISVPESPLIASSVSMPNYTHDATTVGNYALITTNQYNPRSGSLYIIDISNPNAPIITGEITTPEYNLYDIAVVDNYAYVLSASINFYQGNQISGIQVFDISNPFSPVNIGNSINFSNYSYVGSDLIIQGNYVFNQNTIFNITDPVSPVLVGEFNPSNLGVPRNIAISGNYAYIIYYHIDMGDSLGIYDISNPYMPVIVGTLTRPIDSYGYHDIEILGNYAYVADGLFGLQVIDITNPYQPKLFSHANIDGAYHIAIHDNYAYLSGNSGLQVVDISNPASVIPIVRGTPDFLNSDLTISNNFVYLQNFYHGLSIIPTAVLSSTSVSNSNYIQAEIPDNLSNGTYDVTLINPDGTLYKAHNAITVSTNKLSPDHTAPALSINPSSLDFGTVVIPPFLSELKSRG